MPLLDVPSSSAPAVRQWLFDQYTEYITPDPLNPDASLLVCFDDPGPNQPEDIVAIGEVVRAMEFGAFVGGGGTGYLAERYTITIDIDVYRGGDDAPAVFNRARLIADTIIAVSRTDLTAGGNVLKTDFHSDSGHGEWDPEHMGRHWLQTVELSFFKMI